MGPAQDAPGGHGAHSQADWLSWLSFRYTGTVARRSAASAAPCTHRSVVVERDDGYLHAQVSSALFGFVDDLELLRLKEGQEVQARSISRLGDSDLSSELAGRPTPATCTCATGT